MNSAVIVTLWRILVGAQWYVHVDADGLLVFVEMRFCEIDAGPFHQSNHRRRREDVVLELARAHCRSRDVGRGSSEAGCETAFHEKEYTRERRLRATPSTGKT